MKRYYYNVFLQISAFLLPFYFIYYGPLNDNPDHPVMKSIRKFLFTGFIFYIVIFIAVIGFENAIALVLKEGFIFYIVIFIVVIIIK